MRKPSKRPLPSRTESPTAKIAVPTLFHAVPLIRRSDRESKFPTPRPKNEGLHFGLYLRNCDRISSASLTSHTSHDAHDARARDAHFLTGVDRVGAGQWQ